MGLRIADLKTATKHGPTTRRQDSEHDNRHRPGRRRGQSSLAVTAWAEVASRWLPAEAYGAHTVCGVLSAGNTAELADPAHTVLCAPYPPTMPSVPPPAASALT